MIRTSLYFKYAGIASNTFGIMNVNISSGMLEEPWVSPRGIKEEKIAGRDKPYFQRLEKEPLKFNVSFAFEDKWDEHLLRQVKRWLTNHEYYQPLIFSDHPEQIYYALVTDDAQVIHNGLSEGYVTLTFRCHDAYSYSAEKLSPVYEWQENPLTLNESDFSTGVLDNLVINSHGQLTIDSAKTRWMNLSPSLTWKDV